jgi:hypothetical protein
MQAFALKSSLACRPLIQLLLSQQVDPTSAIDGAAASHSSLAGLTPLHLLASYHATYASLDYLLDPESASRLQQSSERDNSPEADTPFKQMAAAYLEHLKAIADLLLLPGGSGSSRAADVNARTQQLGETAWILKL